MSAFGSTSLLPQGYITLNFVWRNKTVSIPNIFQLLLHFLMMAQILTLNVHPGSTFPFIQAWDQYYEYTSSWPPEVGLCLSCVQLQGILLWKEGTRRSHFSPSNFVVKISSNRAIDCYRRIIDVRSATYVNVLDTVANTQLAYMYMITPDSHKFFSLFADLFSSIYVLKLHC